MGRPIVAVGVLDALDLTLVGLDLIGGLGGSNAGTVEGRPAGIGDDATFVARPADGWQGVATADGGDDGSRGPFSDTLTDCGFDGLVDPNLSDEIGP